MRSGEKAIAGGCLLVSFAVGLTVGGQHRPMSVTAGAVLLAVVLAAWAVLAVRGRRRARHTQAGLAGALSRAQVLGELGDALLVAGDPAEVHQATEVAAGDLLRSVPGGWASVLAATPAAAGPGVASGSAGALPADLLARLAAGAVLTGATPAELGLTGIGDPQPITLLPLVRDERFFGVLAASAAEPLPDAVAAALGDVRTQASLAFDCTAATAELDSRATRDALTGLGNRGLLRDRLTAALARARRGGRPIGVLLLDLQGFRQVNEVHGHDAGDELLRVVADRLRAGVRTEDTIGRLGGDQFAVIAEDLRTAQDIVIIAERLVGALGRSVPVAGRLVRAPASVGVALSHPDTQSPDQLLREAEEAMSAAKQRGGSRYQLHGAPCAA